ncbi:tRNA (guanosine(18)-2'-O)-methyltransferase TrmH [Glaciecola siphonariae]|uniref:tRNA (guanosine(18)-2'-O)-methyltransferase n=1 Tax=Glaciecola siphonariae TaxID=521012 RepID=A0ABV9LX99_9ALTE
MSPERYQKINQVLAKRQPDLTLLLEEVHKPHNVSAVIRSADAVGVCDVHAVWEQNKALRKGTAMGSQVWVKTHAHSSLSEAINVLHQQNMQVLVTHLDDTAVDFRDIDYTQPTAILLGQEKTGATDEAVALADKSVVVPMVGMVQSLNVSVAAAVILYEAQRQREAAGMYHIQKVSEQHIQETLFQGGFPIIYKECKRRNLPFPRINEQGCIEADEQWWQALQFS